jgi:hypothetical protein
MSSDGEEASIESRSPGAARVRPKAGLASSSNSRL